MLYIVKKKCTAITANLAVSCAVSEVVLMSVFDDAAGLPNFSNLGIMPIKIID